MSLLLDMKQSLGARKPQRAARRVYNEAPGQIAVGSSFVKVTHFLEQARVCADLAERLTGEDRKRLLDMAHEWLSLAKQAASQAERRASQASRR
jgi:hypothetical protein